MVSVPVPALPVATRIRPRTALVASADRSFRQRLSETLTGLRWLVREAEGGAQAWAEAEAAQPEAIIVDSWLPDLEQAEFLKDFRIRFPEVDLVTASGSMAHESPRGPYRQELLYALRRTQDNDTAIWNATPALTRPQATKSATPQTSSRPVTDAGSQSASSNENAVASATVHPWPSAAVVSAAKANLPTAAATETASTTSSDRLPELIGYAPCMLEVSRRIRLVAPRSTPVLIEGPTGSGKELVAEGLHRLSTRSRKPFVAINCAAIPEALLEAELFGHTRGAFTGAVQGRVGRIESADGGTLFLDEIGEMPLALQSKLLRFVECGELQRVGDNETVKVDVRILTATHQPLAQQTQSGAFRADLYYRLAVFLIRTPALSEHNEDLPLLVDHFMARMGREAPVKKVAAEALAKLTAHDWPGNVRELEHVLERAAILAGDESVLTAREIDFGLAVN
ncbi:MAG: sigma-54 dependent transcriptional regulator [Terracidiphilus sp.]|jgi:DNA-binding NtrC family response regulator